jgi:hypothetical protein
MAAHASPSRFRDDADFLGSVLASFSTFAATTLDSVHGLDLEAETEFRDALMRRAASDPKGPAVVDVVVYVCAVVCVASASSRFELLDVVSAYADSLDPRDHAGRIVCSRHVAIARSCSKGDPPPRRLTWRAPRLTSRYSPHSPH